MTTLREAGSASPVVARERGLPHDGPGELAAPPGGPGMTTPRIGLVLHPRRDVSAVVARVAAWTAGHGVELAAATEDVRMSRL